MDTEDVLNEDKKPQPEYSNFGPETAASLKAHYGQKCDYCGARYGSHPAPLLNRHSNMAASGERYKP